jgi:RNA polymerase sigma factor (sigma-70 family)
LITAPTSELPRRRYTHKCIVTGKPFSINGIHELLERFDDPLTAELLESNTQPVKQRGLFMSTTILVHPDTPDGNGKISADKDSSSDTFAPPIDAHDQWPIDRELLSSLPDTGRDFVTATLETNILSGRAARVIGKMRVRQQVFKQFWDGVINFSLSLTWEELWVAYQHRVKTVFDADSERILALHRHNEQAWQALIGELTNKAISYLTRFGFSPECACDRAAEMAQETCECALAHSYPCDVPLNYWLYTILKNKNLHVFSRSLDLLDRNPTVDSLDDLEERGVHISARSFTCTSDNHSAEDPSYSSAQMDAFIHAINQMQSEERRLVVAYTYFADMTDDEIAARLHKSKAVVHILRHRALKQLRTLIEE